MHTVAIISVVWCAMCQNRSSTITAPTTMLSSPPINTSDGHESAAGAENPICFAPFDLPPAGAAA